MVDDGANSGLGAVAYRHEAQSADREFCRALEQLAAYDLQIIRELQEQDPEIAKTHNHLAYIHVKRQDYVSAATNYQKSLRIWPGNSDAQRGLAYLSRMQQDERLTEKE